MLNLSLVFVIISLEDNMEQSRINLVKKATLQGVIVSLLLALTKIGLGLKTHSTALFADGLHTAADVGIAFIIFKGFVIANKPADDKYNYGYHKAEAVTAKILSLILVVMAVLAGKSAISNLSHPHSEEFNYIGIIVVLIGIVIKEYSYRHGVHLAKEIKSNAIMAEAWHNRNAALTSIPILVGLVGAQLGLPILDPLTGLAVSALILVTAVKLYLKSLRDLMDSAPEAELYAYIVEATTNTPGVENIHGVKARRNGHAVYVDMNMCVPSSTSFTDSYKIGEEAKAAIIGSHEDIKDVTLQVKPCFKDIKKESCRNCPVFLSEQIQGKECDAS
jgi:cation diffusion facilitator family transporter